MKNFIHTIVLLLIILCSELYSQIDFKDNSIPSPLLLKNQIVLETPNRVINPAELDSLITTTMGTYHIPGLTALIVKHDSIVWNKNYGYADIALNKTVEDSTLFHMASISKTFIITAIMQLWEDGLFDLEDNINDYLQPEFQVHNPYYPNDTITFKMLMTHTSSINDNENILIPLMVCGDSPVPFDYFLTSYFTPDSSYYSITNFLPQSPSDTLYEYTNVGSSILAFIVEKLSLVPFPEYCRDNIFIPLNMNLTSWFLEGLDTNGIATPYEWSGGQYIRLCHQGWPPYPAVSLRTNKIELEHFLTAYMNNGIYNGYTLLNSSTIDTMLTVYKYVPQSIADRGLIWFRIILNNRRLWGHTGGWDGTTTSMFFNQEEDWGYIIFMNYWIGNNTLVYLNQIISEYAHIYGHIYALNTKVNKPYISSDDTLTINTNFSNINQHNFSANAIYISSDNSFIDSTVLYDDGLHGDSLASDGLWGGFIHSIAQEEIFNIGISTKDLETGEYFYSGDQTRFTTAGPIVVDTLIVTKLANSYRVKPFIKNEGQSFTVEDLQIIMSSEDSSITNITGSVSIATIAPGEVVEPLSSFYVIVDSSFNGEFNFDFEIQSSEWTYWYHSKSAIVTSIEKELPIPSYYSLHQNYPNPFNPITTIKYQIPELSFVTLKVYDVLGNEILTLVNEEKPIGTYEITWYVGNLPSGVYFYQLKAGSFIETKKMVLLK